MKPEKICANCVHCTRENYCLHRQGPYKTWDENYCNNFESKEKDNETMNEELRKKYGNMTIDDMIEKMEEQEMWIKALEQDGRNYHNELLENRARISDLERAYDRVYEENATFVKRNEALDKRATELVKSVEEKDERIKDLEDRLAVANRSITSYHSEIKKTREKDAELVKSVEEKDEQIEKLKNELDEANVEIGELGGRITERYATNRELAKNCVRLETENREKEAKIADLMQQLADKNVTVKDLDAHNDELLKDFGEAAKEVEEKRTRIIELENELREKEDTIINKDMYITHLEHEVIKKGDKINSLINENREKEANIASLTQELEDIKAKALANVQKAINTCCLPTHCPVIKSAIEEYSKKCEEEAKPKLSYKCCPEIKKLIDDSGYMRDYMERVIRGDSSYNLDISSLYPNKFDLNPNADCPAYAARMKAKYDSLIKVGFTEDQAMAMIPMWTDECGE